MIDHISFKVLSGGFARRLLENPTIRFEQSLTDKGNVVHKANDRNMCLEVYEPSFGVKISGSIHKYFDNGYNWTDFSRLCLYDTLCEFCGEFEIDPKAAQIHCMEFGVNIEVPFDPSYFIKRILNYKSGKIELINGKAEIRDGISINFTQYKLKIYNKSKQNKLEKNLLRFEVKIGKMQKLRGLGEKLFLNDLMKAETLQKLGSILLQEFNKLIIFEPLDTRKMTLRESSTYKKMSERVFWLGIGKGAGGLRRESVKIYKGLIAKYGGVLQNQMSHLISEKWNELLAWNSLRVEGKDHIFLPGVSSMKNDDTDHSSRDLNSKKPTLFYQDNYEALLENNVSKARSLKCPNCKKIIKHNDGKYCNSRCKELLQKRGSLKNTRKKITHIYENLQLFDQSDFIKIDPRIRQLLLKGRCL